MPSALVRLSPLLALGAVACVYDFDGYVVGAGGAGGAGGSATTSSSTSTSSSSGSTTSSVGGGGMGGAGAGGAGGTGGMGGAGGSECVDDGEGSCAPWWDPLWGKRRRITIDNTGLSSNLTNFPWLVRLDAQSIDYASTLDDGGDVRFVSYDGTAVLAHEIERWDEAGTSSVWVNLGELEAEASGPHYLWMYYGNAAPPAPALPATSVWDAEFVSVHHLTGDFDDSTTSANHGGTTAANAMPTSLAEAPVAGGYDFDGTDDHVVLPDEADYDFTNALTVSTWLRVDGWARSWEAVVTKGDDSWRLARENNTRDAGFGTTHGTNSQDNLRGSTDVDDNQWHQVVIVYDGVQKRIFIDGAQDAQKNFSQTLRNSNRAVCFGENLQATGRFLDGQLDEVRISKVARSADWIRFEHLTVTEPTRTTFSMEQLPQP